MGAARADLERWLAGAALLTCDGAHLADAFMTALRDVRVIAPSPSTFERLCAAALVEAERQVLRMLSGALESHHVADLDDLLSLPDKARLTPLGALRAAPAGAGTAGLHDLLDRLDQLRALGLPPMPSATPMPRVTRLAEECARITVAHLREMNAARRAALLFAFVADALPRVTDIAIDAALDLIGSVFKRAERRCLDALVENRCGIGDIVRVHADLAAALISGRAEGRDLSAVVEEAVGWAALARSAETAARLREPVAADVLERIDAEHPRLRRFGPRCLDAFVFRGAPGTASLMAALDRLRDGGKSVGEGDDPPVDFVPARWLPLIRREGEIDRKLYILCVLSRLRDALRAGDVWVDGSLRYRRFEDRLLAPMAGTGKAAAGPVGDILRLDVETWIEGRRERLDALLALTERQAAEGALPDPAIRNGRLVVTPLKNATPETARDLARRLYGLLRPWCALPTLSRMRRIRKQSGGLLSRRMTAGPA